jgi:hypothetical protein
MKTLENLGEVNPTALKPSGNEKGVMISLWSRKMIKSMKDSYYRLSRKLKQPRISNSWKHLEKCGKISKSVQGIVY